ncbi:hypothetical protein L1887_00549 [Cichorium endivia]|nr:hypothetical protein L1887_00549 [Cichorium endivia]
MASSPRSLAKEGTFADWFMVFGERYVCLLALLTSSMVKSTFVDESWIPMALHAMRCPPSSYMSMYWAQTYGSQGQQLSPGLLDARLVQSHAFSTMNLPTLTDIEATIST